MAMYYNAGAEIWEGNPDPGELPLTGGALLAKQQEAEYNFFSGMLPGLKALHGPGDTGYGEGADRYYTQTTPDWASYWADTSITSPYKTWENWIGPSPSYGPASGAQYYTPEYRAAEALRQTHWNARDADAMRSYLGLVSQAIGQPDYDWLPYLQQAQTEHQGTFGIPWVSNRSNPYAAINAVLGKAGLSQFNIAPDAVAQQTDIIQQTQNAMGGDWLEGPGPWMLASVLTAGALGALGAGAAGGELAGVAGAEAAALGGTGAGLLETGGLAGVAGAGGAMDMGVGLSEWANALGGTAGATGAGGGMDLADILASQDAFWADPNAMNLPGGLSQMMTDAGMVQIGSDWYNLNDITKAQDAFWSSPTSMNLPGGLSQLATEAAKKIGVEATKGLLSKILGGTATADDWGKLVGAVGPALLGAYGARQQSSDLKDLAEKYMGFGAPSRARYEASMSPGFDPNTIPGYAGALDTTSRSVLANLAASGGNPFGNPGGLIDANKKIVAGTALPAINEYQRLNANTGFGQSMTSAGNYAAGGIGADQGIYGALGYGLGNLLNPPNSLEQILRQARNAGLTLTGGTGL